MTRSAAHTLWTIFIIIAVIVAVIIFHPILILLFIALLLTLALRPPVEWLKKKGVPRTVSVVVIIAIFLALIAAAVFFLGPNLVTQATLLIERAPETLRQVESALDFTLFDEDVVQQIVSVARDASGVLFSAATAVATAVTSFVIIVVLSLYWLIYYDEIKQKIFTLVPKARVHAARRVIQNVEKNLQAWVIGQVILSVAVGVLVFIAFTIIGLPYALPLAVLAAVLEIVPNLGPILAVIPALFVGFSDSSAMALAVLGAYVIIQTVESYLLTPKIMGRVTRLNPFFVIVAILVGTHLLGLIGAFIAVPTLLLIISVIQGITAGKKIS